MKAEGAADGTNNSNSKETFPSQTKEITHSQLKNCNRAKDFIKKIKDTKIHTLKKRVKKYFCN